MRRGRERERECKRGIRVWRERWEGDGQKKGEEAIGRGSEREGRREGAPGQREEGR